MEWLVLVHQIPPKPDYFRVKVRRRLQRLGAVALKNSVYLLPRQDETLEDFQWLVREIRGEGGEATLCQATFLDGLTDAEVVTLFRAERDAEYAEIEQAARTLAGGAGESTEGELARLRRRLEDVMRTDFFDAPGHEGAERALAAAQLKPALSNPGQTESVRGATWVTRSGVRVDRMGSAWLIRRFIDPEAQFRFVPGKEYSGAPDELRFDMFQGEYTHEGDRCTFEVLLDRFGLEDPALRAIGEIVHDIDCKDERFGRPEAAGIAAIVNGIVLTQPGDAERLQRGSVVFEGLFAQLRTP